MRLGFAKWLDRVGGGLLGRGIAWTDAVSELVRSQGTVPHVSHLLVVKFWGLGNWALLRPLVMQLRARYPGARLTIATLRGNRPLVEDLADELLLIDPSDGFGIVGDLVRAIRRLRATRPELAVDFEQFSRTGALLARLGGIPQRIGFRSGEPGRDRLYTVTVPFRSDVHVTRSFRDLAEAAGLPSGAYEPGGLVADPARLARLAAIHRIGPRSVVLHPGSGDNFPGRRWSEAGFAAVGRAAVAEGYRVWVTGGEGERELALAIAQAIGPDAISLAGALDIPDLVALLAHARALVSNDTGPVHIASQLGTPVLAFFGPNTPVLYGPLSAGSRNFYRALPCSPCLTNANYRSSRCRIHTCMHSIPTGEVIQVLRTVLSRDEAVAQAGQQA